MTKSPDQAMKDTVEMTADELHAKPTVSIHGVDMTNLESLRNFLRQAVKIQKATADERSKFEETIGRMGLEAATHAALGLADEKHIRLNGRPAPAPRVESLETVSGRKHVAVRRW